MDLAWCCTASGIGPPLTLRQCQLMMPWWCHKFWQSVMSHDDRVTFSERTACGEGRSCCVVIVLHHNEVTSFGDLQRHMMTSQHAPPSSHAAHSEKVTWAFWTGLTKAAKSREASLSLAEASANIATSGFGLRMKQACNGHRKVQGMTYQFYRDPWY